MSQKQINILQLYPDEMNIYGDWGNTLVLKRRLEWAGYSPVISSLNIGEKLPAQIDIIVGGGGQDSNQLLVTEDIAHHRNQLEDLVKTGVPMLLICGMYQLFGHSFNASGGVEIKGIGLFDVTTTAGEGRLIGNTIIDTKDFGQIVGYENHSGRTILGEGATAFGEVLKGDGNNGEDRTEGCRLHNAIGTYLHGSILPKNPRLADFMISTAAINRYGSYQPQEIDDKYVEQARNIAMNRPR